MIPELELARSRNRPSTLLLPQLFSYARFQTQEGEEHDDRAEESDFFKMRGLLVGVSVCKRTNEDNDS